MTPERWRQVKSVLAAALERQPEERPRFVAEACGDDAELRGDVESLIEAEAGCLIPTDPGAVPAPPPARLAPGARLGRYEVCALLAVGGMGEVYRARDTRLGREVALKLLPDAFAADAGRLARFEREARAVAALNHPHIVTLHSLEEVDGLRFLTMELVQGHTLDQLIPPRGVAVETLIAYARPLCDALRAAHERGIVHRDLKPGNVMLAADGRLKLLDFGLATVAAGGDAFTPLDDAGPLTREGVLVGTCRYMSPEQLRGRALDCRSDVFALGVVLYELATGHAPFDGATFAETCSAILREAPVPVSTLRPDVPGALSALIMRCLEKEPGRRHADAGAVHAELVRPAAPAVGPSKTPSVAVLPFLNLGVTAEDEFFADGITEDVIAHLSKIRSLKVISRTSVMPFRKRAASLREIAARLGTATVLEGSVRRVGDRVRIVAQLIDAETDDHLWADTYDRDLTDIFAIQTDVALQIAAALRAELSAGERTRIRRPPTRDLDAYRLYVQGRYCFSRFTPEGFGRAVRYFEQAVAEDSAFALAHVGLAQTYAEDSNEGLLGLAPEVAFGRAKEAVARALSLDDSLGDAHGIVAFLRFAGDFDWTGAEQEFRLALELTPGSADIHTHYGWMCSALERFDDAIRLAERARELDPMAHRSDLGTALLRAGRHSEALELGARLVEQEPGFARGHSISGWACLKLGRRAEGLAALERAATLSPGGTMFLGQLGQAYGITGQPEKAREVLRQLQERARQAYVPPYHYAYVHTGLGEQDQAIDWLERAREDRAGPVYGIKGSFLFSSLRSHPRFTALLHKMNLASSHLRAAPGDEADNPPSAHETTPSAAETPRMGRGRGRTTWLAGALAAAALLALLIWFTPVLRRNADAPDRPRIRSLAVLPLANLTGDPGQEYFSDGMTDALITNLASLPALRVISRQSVMRYKGSAKPLPEIARELGVEGVVEGTVVRAGGRVRITAQLIHAPTDRHLWAHSYERRLEDVLALQGELARAIAEQVRVTVGTKESRRLGVQRAVKPDAYDAYLLGRHHWNPRTEEALDRALGHFRASVASDPDFALAHAGLALTYGRRQIYAYVPPGTGLAEQKAAALKALELDTGLGDARAALGAARTIEWDWPAAETEFRTAIEDDPGSTLGHAFYGWYLHALRRFDEALVQQRRALELDPLDITVNRGLARFLGATGQDEAALAQWNRTLEVDLDHARTHVELALFQFERGRREEGSRHLQRARGLEFEDPPRLASLAVVHAAGGNGQEARRLLEKLESESARRYVSPVLPAMIHVALAENDRAFALLDKACAAKDPALISIQAGEIGPIRFAARARLAALRADPRFGDLLRRMGRP